MITVEMELLMEQQHHHLAEASLHSLYLHLVKLMRALIFGLISQLEIQLTIKILQLTTISMLQTMIPQHHNLTIIFEMIQMRHYKMNLSTVTKSYIYSF